MSEKKEYIRNPIDFRPARGHVDTSLIYTVLMHYNGTRHTKQTASKLIADAYKHYDPSEPEEFTRMKDCRTKAAAFVTKYGIKSFHDAVQAAKFIPRPENVDLLEPNEKNFTFDMTDPVVKDMWEKLTGIRYRDRGILINKFLYQYMANGNSEYYKSLSADRLFSWLKDEYDFLPAEQVGRFKESVDLIMSIAGIEPEPEKDEKKEDLRKIIGLKKELK